MYVARDIAATAPTDRQRRILMRPVLLHADTALRYVGVWHKVLDRDVTTRPVAHAARTPLKHLRREYARHKDARDKLASRRQAVVPGRAADLRGTVRLWGQLVGAGVHDLCSKAAAACLALGEADGLTRPVEDGFLEAAKAALMVTALSSDNVYLDGTSYASGEPNLMSVTVGGSVGRRIMQINDVHDHLEELNALRPLLDGTDEVGLVLRTALVVELCSMLDLSFGPQPESTRLRDGPPLLDLLSRDRGAEGYDVLVELRDKIVGPDTHATMRELRDRICAHMDLQLTLDEILGVLAEIDVQHYLMLGDVLLDWFDVAAIQHVDLGLLAIGHRQMRTFTPPAHATVPAAFQAEEQTAFLDSPYLGMVAGGFGPTASAGVAGAISGRGKNRRERWRPPVAAG
jgi:hypothetical protein